MPKPRRLEVASSPKVCPVCRISGFKRDGARDGKPCFRCQRCEHTWTSGPTGAPYAGNEQVGDDDVLSLTVLVHAPPLRSSTIVTHGSKTGRYDVSMSDTGQLLDVWHTDGVRFDDEVRRAVVGAALPKMRRSWRDYE